MAENYDLSVKIDADPSALERGLKKAQDACDRLKKHFEESGGSGVVSLGKMGQSLQTLGGGLQRVGAGFNNYITKPALAAATAVGAITLGKGWARMTEIDTARAKLEALSTASVKAGRGAFNVAAIQDDALKAVKGTAYGLDQAMTSAASAVAAGIKPGKDLQHYLTLVGDAAAISGRSMSDMGSIIGKVATAGRAYTMEINMIADSGVAIWQALADEAGVSTDEIRKWAENGKISADMFYTALDNAVGGAAKTIGSTTIIGALANIGASISRIGANIFGVSNDADSVAGQLLPTLNSFTKYLGGIEEKAAGMGKTLGAVFKGVRAYLSGDGLGFLEAMGGANAMNAGAAKILTTLQPLLQTINDLRASLADMSGKSKAALAGITIGAGPALLLLGKLTSAAGGLFTMFADGGKFAWITELAGGSAGLLKMLGIVGAIGAAFAVAYANSEPFRNSINALAASIGQLLGGAFKAVMPLIGQLLTSAGQLVTAIATAVAPVIKTVADTISKTMQVLTPFINTAVKVITTAVKGITAVFRAVFNTVYKIVAGTFNKIKAVWTGLTTVVSTIASGIGSAFSKLIGIVKGIINGFIRGVNAAIGIINKIPGVEIGRIQQLYHGTDDWRGGFAAMNEGGRGEITYLPNGTQVIPHDISVAYAKEAGKSTNGATIDAESLTEAFTAAVVRLAPYLQNGMAQAVDGMSVQVNRRELGRVIQQEASR